MPSSSSATTGGRSEGGSVALLLPFDLPDPAPLAVEVGREPAWKEHYRQVSPASLATARSLTRGRREREWLAPLLEERVGLHPSGGVYGKQAPAATVAVLALVNRLQLNGFVIERRPLGSRGALHHVLVGHAPEFAPLLRAVAPRTGCTGQPIKVRSTHPSAAFDVLHAWARSVTPAAVETATALASNYSGPLLDLLAAAEALSL